MFGAHIIVRARISARGFGAADPNDLYEFRAGEHGRLSLQVNKGEITYYRVLVTWDNDPEHKARVVLSTDLIVVGLENNGCRFSVENRQALQTC